MASLVPGEIQDLVLSCKSKSKILSWNVAVGDQVKKDSVLATYVFTEKITDPNNFIVNRKLKAKCPGSITEIAVEPEQEVQRGQVVARLEEEQCQHNTVIKDMCVDCGGDLRREPGIPGELSEPVTASIPAVHNILELKVSVEEALRLARYDEEQLLKARKLVLVVDLDMTLIHTTVQHVPKGTKDVFSFTLPGHQYEYHTKLRPNARKFLESISKFFELHIFTMGSRMYAHTVAKCLDPDGKFFAHRIRSRDEFINSFSKFHDLKALFPCGDHMVCIIDDREDVWSYAPNLIVVKPYKIFKGSDDINDPFKPELTLTDSFGVNGKQPSTAVVEAKIDEPKPEEAETLPETSEQKKTTEEKDSAAKGEEGNEPTTAITTSATTTSPSKETPIEPPKETEVPQQQMTRSFFINAKADLDDNLYHVDKVLRRVHCKFYSVVDVIKSKGDSVRKTSRVAKFCSPKTLKPDVRVIVPRIRRQILKGCNIVFTGVIPRNVPPEKSKHWKTAVSLGARVHSEIIPKNDIHPGTTHVIAARHGTKKSFDAYQSPDIHLVHPSWLACAKEKWKRPLEDLFPVPVEPIEEEIFLDQQKDSSDDKYTPFPVELKQKSEVFRSSLPLPLPLPDLEVENLESESGDNMIDFSMDNFSVIPSSEELDGMHKEIEDLLHNSSMDSNGSLELDLVEDVISNGDLSKTSAERDSPIEKKARRMTFSSVDIEKRGLSRLRLNSTNSDR